MFWVVMYKDGGVPAPIQSTRTAMIALGAFIKYHVPRGQGYLVRVTFKVCRTNKSNDLQCICRLFSKEVELSSNSLTFNENWPILGIFRFVNVENERDNMGLTFVHMHPKLGSSKRVQVVSVAYSFDQKP